MPGTSNVIVDELPQQPPSAADIEEIKKFQDELDEARKKVARYEAAPEKPANVIQALARVMEELPGIGKDSKSEQNYQYRGIEAITAHAQRLLGKYGVVFVPQVVERNVKDLTINGKPWTQEELKIVYTIYGPGGVDDKITVGPLYGLGRDNSDKGANKSMTQAYKYALLQVLCVGDSKDDADRDVAHEADAVQVKPPMSDKAREAADDWPDDDAFEQGHHAYRSAAGKLKDNAKKQLKEWKAQNKFGVWMTPDEFEATMEAINKLLAGETIIELSDPQPTEQPVEPAENPEQAEPAVETPEKSEPPVETTTAPLVYEGKAIDEMTGRETMEALKALGLPVRGNVEQLRHNLREHLRAQSSVTESQQGEQPVDETPAAGENAAVTEQSAQDEAQVNESDENKSVVETYDENDPGKPF